MKKRNRFWWCLRCKVVTRQPLKWWQRRTGHVDADKRPRCGKCGRNAGVHDYLGDANETVRIVGPWKDAPPSGHKIPTPSPGAIVYLERGEVQLSPRDVLIGGVEAWRKRADYQERAKLSVIAQAQGWAMEARMQKATVDAVGEILGMEDYEDIPGRVRDLVGLAQCITMTNSEVTVVSKVAHARERVADIIEHHDGRIEIVREDGTSELVDDDAPPDPIDADYSESLEGLLSKHTAKCLAKAGILALGDLTCCTEQQLLAVKGIGYGRVGEITTFLARHNRKLRPNWTANH